MFNRLKWVAGVAALLLLEAALASAGATLTGDLPRRADLQFRTDTTDGSLVVSDLTQGAPAHKSGLELGDVITAVNGARFEKSYEGIDLLRRLDGNAPATLELQRNGATLEMVFRPVVSQRRQRGPSLPRARLRHGGRPLPPRLRRSDPFRRDRSDAHRSHGDEPGLHGCPARRFRQADHRDHCGRRGAVTYFERMLNFDRIRLEWMGVAPQDIHEKMLKHILFQVEYLLRKKTPEEIAEAHPELADVWSEILGTGDGVHYGRPYSYHQQAARRDFLEAWSAIGAPILVVFGEYDQFELRHGHELIVKVANHLRPGVARFVEIPRMGHDYGVYPTIEAAYSWTHGPGAPGHDAPELVIGEILRWLEEDVGVDTLRLP